MTIWRLGGLAVVVLSLLLWACTTQIHIRLSSRALNRISQNVNPPAKKPISLAELIDRQTKGPATGQTGRPDVMQTPQLTSLCDPQGRLRDMGNPYNQETTRWCWATSAQTVLEFHKEIRDQCSWVNSALLRQDCCGVREFDPFLNIWFITTPLDCDQAGWPHWVFDKSGFDYEILPAPGTSNLADWTAYVEPLKRQICRNGPFISALQLEGGVAEHTQVVVGIYDDPQVIEVNNHRTADFNTQPLDVFIGDALNDPNGEYGYAQDFFYVEIRRL
jgi:hypothetical protein